MTEVEARERVAPLQSGDAAQEVVGRVEVAQRRGDALEPLDRVVGEVEAGERDVCACEACEGQGMEGETVSGRTLVSCTAPNVDGFTSSVRKTSPRKVQLLSDDKKIISDSSDRMDGYHLA